MNTKEQILRCTLELASETGLGNVSLQKIADRVGVRKATLFSHYKSKDEIIEALYRYIRTMAVANRKGLPLEHPAFLQDKTAVEVLESVVFAYKAMNESRDMAMFYRFIYSERVFNPLAAKIMIEETQTMLAQVQQLLAAMQESGLLRFPCLKTAATAFCLTIHELLDLGRDYAANGQPDKGRTMICDYITGFCKEYKSGQSV
ncbi:hypothetical protein NRIC_17450 [Enterococcus florum]|uniref:HTH tetR-type domain-containing protein n=1 Tax=Enterococcus florum TaxID=2480627 RepID=A0A4P5PBL0_9ENTE|nr:TetR/AcrR family transcriptional regulator [Enterococcus florum]GCF93854.1 hypothetical protein NRIC_17450 [Enterococcus florum]